MGGQDSEGEAELKNRSASLIVVPFGSVTLTVPLKTCCGNVKISTLPETSPVGSVAVVLVQVPVPLRTMQLPELSVKLIVKSERAGDDAKVSPAPRAANADAASAIRFMIVTPQQSQSPSHYAPDRRYR
jgi:hypothetical protein